MKAKTKKTNKRASRVKEGSGNIFADLGLPNPEQELLKAQLTLQIYTILKASGLTQVELAKILGVQQPQISLLMRNRAGNFSVGRLMEFLTALRQDVQITVRPSRKQHGALSVISARIDARDSTRRKRTAGYKHLRVPSTSSLPPE
jgi:predicted XRE-type DNA-binding protein